MTRDQTGGQQTCCGVIEEARFEARARRARRKKPQPWIVRKLVVGLTVGIIAYASYVYIGIFCVDMIKGNKSALGGRATGVVFLVIFCILLLMMLWSYAKVVITPPGFARDFVQKSEKPMFPEPGQDERPWHSDLVAGRPYESTEPADDFPGGPSDDRTVVDTLNERPDGKKPDKLPRAHRSKTSTSSRATNENPEEAGIRHVLAPGIIPEAPAMGNGTLHVSPGSQGQNFFSSQIARRPSSTPILLPEYRYCSRDGFIKPLRTHHCRACSTCVLKYDHHCPWIGQCVGAFNQKFFVNFLEWTAILCFWVFSTLLGLNVRPSSRDTVPSLNAQHVVVIAIAALFGLFSSLMLMTQVHLILLNQTTVESLAFRTMKASEQANLAQMFPWYQFGAKRQTRLQWDFEWGHPTTEGNLWFMDTRENWTATMGKNVWWWFLPIGRSPTDGLHYPTNPRFDSQGRWRPRKEWPADLQ